MANYDGLTDLVNRTFFQTELEKAIARAERSEANVAVFLLDVDHFKYVNDRYGHDIGDKLLTEVSRRLTRCVRRGDTVARLGGDEFAILLLDFNSTDNLVLIATNLVEQVARPIHLDDVTLNVSASIGVGMLEGDHMTPDELLKTADTAMYVAKNAGRNTYRFFHPEMQARAEEKQRIQVALQQAIKQNEFELVYQPIYSLDDMSLQHSEALLRWIPTGGELILPKVFIPLAEESGRITEIGEWVLNHVIQQLLDWRRHLGECPRVAINISSKQIRNPHFRETIEQHIRDSSFDPTALELELTETGVMDDPDTVMSELVKLSELGVRISIDDFGTGYSSLDYLRRLPIHQIKIDKSFVRGIGESQHDEEIVRVIIAVAHTMNIRVIAEGIETNDQLEFLKNCGGDMGQGFLFGTPLQSFELMEVYRRDSITMDSLPGSPESAGNRIQ
jgi:diguanylate cyclase (GGDEF)-like protein